MSILMNILWLLLGGIFTAVEYVVASLGMMITIIGIPFGLQTLKMSLLALCPFGKRIETTPQSGGCLSIIMNILWICLNYIYRIFLNCRFFYNHAVLLTVQKVQLFSHNTPVCSYLLQNHF